MKKISQKIVLLLVIAAVTIVLVPSCKKYPEGPSFSLLTKKARLTGEWTLKKLTENGQDEDLTGLTYVVTIDKDGTFKYKVSFAGFSVEEKGKWEFDSSKENVIFTLDGSTEKQTSKILKLKNKELWLQEIDGADITEYHYEQ